VGRVEHEKGIGYLLEWFNNVFNYDRINKLYIIGDGKDKLFFESYVEKKTSSKLKILFVGSLVREELFEYYKKCHFLILPTYASEGFPKVVAEASAFGCIPVTTPVSSIHQYVKNGFNGYDWSYWKRNFNLIISNPNLNEVALNANRTAHLFTYEHYLNRLKETVFHVHR
jgi:glycosyltransferase involved in cell wall biosynthesis